VILKLFPYLNWTAVQAFGLDLYAGLLRVWLGIVVLCSAKSRNGRTIKVNKNNHMAFQVVASNHLVGSSIKSEAFETAVRPPRRGESSAYADEESISPGAPNNKCPARKSGAFLFVVSG